MKKATNLNLLLSLLALLVIAVGMAGQSRPFMAVGFFTLGAQGAVNLFGIMQAWKERWSLCAIHGSALLAWYGVGAFIGLSWGEPWELGMSDSRDYSDLFSAALFLTLSANAILVLAPLEHRFWSAQIRRLDLPAPPVPPLVLLALVVLWVVLVDFIVEGRIDFRSFGTESSEYLPITEVLVLQTSMALSGYFGWLLGKRREGSTQVLTILALLFLPLLLLVLVGQGRRDLVVHIAAFFLIFAWSRDMRLTWKPLALFSLLAIPLLLAGSMVFQAQRLATSSYAMSWSGKTNLIERIDSASERFRGDWDEVLESQIESFPSRMFIIDYLKELMGTSDKPQFGFGRASAAQAVMGVPTFLYPGKAEEAIRLGGIGEMRNPDFGLPDFSDYANSLLTVAYMDFGWLGIPYAALLTLLSGWLLAQLFRLARNELFQVVALSLILTHYLTVEQNFVTTAVNVLRLAVALAPLTALLSVSQDQPDSAPVEEPGLETGR